MHNKNKYLIDKIYDKIADIKSNLLPIKNNPNGDFSGMLYL